MRVCFDEMVGWCVRACARACVRACVRVCVHACVRVWGMWVYLYLAVFGLFRVIDLDCVCAWCAYVCTHTIM